MIKRLFPVFIKRKYWKFRKCVNPLLYVSAMEYIKNKPIYVFHHLPRTGGTSLRLSLHKWFKVKEDYRPSNENDRDWEEQSEAYNKESYKISDLRPFNILCGHFKDTESYIEFRYPEIWKNTNKFKIFTFIRDPFSFKISSYFYLKKREFHYIKNISLEEFLTWQPNHFAFCLNCNESNYKAKLERYFYIGIFENYEDSIKKLSRLIERPQVELTHINSSTIKYTLNAETISKFQDDNSLDYKIYKYCLDMYHQY